MAFLRSVTKPTLRPRSGCADRLCRLADAENSPQVANDLPSRVVPRHARDAAAGVRPGAAEIEACQRQAIVAVPQDRARAEELVQRQLAVEDVAPHKTEGALEVQGGENAP